MTYNADMDDISNRTFQMRVNDAWLAKIDDWRRHQPDLPPRAEAIRRLVELALKARSSDEA